MNYSLALAAILLSCASVTAACPWAGGSFQGNTGNFRTEFTVNKDCTSMVFESSGNAGFQRPNTAETFALASNSEGWAANINGVTATLLRSGRWVNFIGLGVNSRVQTRSVRGRGGQR